MNGLLVLSVMTYLAGAGWQDLRTRRICNLWNAGCGLGFILLHIWQGTWVAALIGLGVMGLGTLIPTLRGWWGVGDWKMAMVLGAAVGALPAALIWFAGCVIARWLQPWLQALSVRHMDETRAATIPLATVVGIAAAMLFCVSWVIRI